MNETTTSFDASPSALGYLYQCRYALLLALQHDEDSALQMSIEKLDDVAFLGDGVARTNPAELLQFKHHVKRPGGLSPRVRTFWKTIRVWSEASRRRSTWTMPYSSWLHGTRRGKPCVGGALVGSDNVAKWFAKGQPEIDIRKLPFAKNPALGAYFNSLVNLGFFVTEDEVADSDEDVEEATLTFDDLELSALGKQLADGYDSLIGQLESVMNLSAAYRRYSWHQPQRVGETWWTVRTCQSNIPRPTVAP